MNFLQNTRISTKILSLLLMLGALTFGLAYQGSSRLRATDASYSDLVEIKLPNSTKLARANRRVSEMAYASYRTIAFDGASAEAKAASADEGAAYQDALKLLGEVKDNEPDAAEKVDELTSKISNAHAAMQQAIAQAMQKRNEQASAIMKAVDKNVDSIGGEMKSYNNARIAVTKKLSGDVSAATVSTSWSMLISSIVGILIAVGISAWVVLYSITRPIKQLSSTMGALARGDRDLDVPGVERGDELGGMAKAVLVFRDAAVAKHQADAVKARADAEQQMVVATLSQGLQSLSEGDLTGCISAEFPQDYAGVKTTFNEALDSLRALIGAVSDGAASISTGSGEIAQASEDLARRTEGNAASLEETSASLAQIDGRLKATATAAARTVERADQAITTVSGGRTVAEQAVQAMGRVSESAKGIDGVIEGLDKIAFQTRVLAMNAAVEAGRAGDAGRGFAVVADLVSALAIRAEEEAKRARDQLTATQTDIITAVEAVQKVDGALADISDDVSEVHELLGTMASDNLAQSAAVTQISVAVSTMDQSTQQNAAMVEETSAAARNLTSEVQALTEQAERFRVGAGHRPRPSSAKSKAYASPVKPLPKAAVAALTRPASTTANEDWSEF